jgi:hypothetical protein
MSKILIVSRTKVGSNKICIGGIDLDKLLSVRLLTTNGHYESKRFCPYRIREIYEIDYICDPRPLPHSEDIRVLNRKKTGELENGLSMLDFLRERNFTIHSGEIKTTFEGKLNHRDSGAFYISEESIPQNSTCFWICDKPLIQKDLQWKIRYHYTDAAYQISYVGLDKNPPQIIPAGTLTRLSLAHWWSPQYSEDEERCYLQLSGWY